MEPTLQEKSVVLYAGDRSETGQYHGYGRAVFSSGQVYDGHWLAGHMNGMGRLSFPDGVTYEGTFESDKITGKGVYQWENTNYEGEVLDGLRHGFGILAFTDSPAVYEGQWEYGKRSGKGTLYYNAERTAYYEGDWQDDMKHGQGTSMYPSGNSYTGSWCADKRHGHGTMNWTSKGQVYKGDWADDLPNGLGEHIWQQGMQSLQVSNHAMQFMFNRYIGMFKDGMRHGEGSLSYSNGARYEGQWEHDKKQGHGVYIFEDGSTFIGQFAADRPVLHAGTFQGAVDTLPAAVGAALAASFSATATTAAIAGADAQAASASGSTAPAADVAAAAPGFGPRVGTLQLYIPDLLQECDAPAATYKAVGNLLVGHNTELRALYDRYCNRMSPLLTSETPRNSWALQAGQLWELLRDSQLLCRHLQLQQACHALIKALEPPPAVEQRRQQVLSSSAAAAVLTQPQHPYDPTIQLLYRDFCELLVRLSAVRYPQLASLEQQVQHVIAQHLLPLVGPGPGRTGGYRQSSAGPARIPLAPQASSATVASSTSQVTARGSAPAAGYVSPAGLAAAAGVSGVGSDQLQHEDLVEYLQSQAGALQQLYAAFVAGVSQASHPAAKGLAEGTQLVAKNRPISVDEHGSICWMSAPVTVRQVVAVLQQTGVLRHWQLAAAVVAGLLLEGVMTVADPEGPRARMDEASLEPADLEEQQHSSSQHAAEAATHLELSYWMDAPLLLAELLWGLVRCAAALPAQQVLAQTTPAGADQQAAVPDGSGAAAGGTDCQVDLLTRTQVWLEGDGGLLDLVLGLRPHKHVPDPAEQQQETDGLQQDEVHNEQGGEAQTADMPEDEQLGSETGGADIAASSRPSTQSMTARPETVQGSRPATSGTQPM